MTEYATDPEAIHEFLTARQRTMNWVDVHSRGLPFMSPSSPPSVLSDEDAPSYGPSESDASSSHSLPPRMLLRYQDGRPDIPIPHDRSARRGGPSAHKSSRHTRSRSGSLAQPAPINVPPMPARQAQSLSYASGSRYASSNPSGQPLVTPPRSPEHIRVLPSRPAGDSQHMAGASTQPQTALPHQPSIHDRVPPLADPLHTTNRSVYTPTSRHASSPTQPIPIAASPVTQPQTHSASGPHNGGSRFYEQPGMAASRVQSGLPYQYSPPAIVYAPSGKHGRSNYHPPAIVYSPSSHGHRRAPAPGIAYSRSDPLPHPTQYSHAGSTPHPSATGSTSRGARQRAHSTTEHLQGRGRSHGSGSGSPRERTRTRSPTPSLSPSDTSTDSSGSTYYVLPSPGQKVQIIVPNAVTVYTAAGKSSSPRSPRSPVSPTDSPKRPFLARIFSRGSGSVDSRGSSGQGKRLRRHTVGDAAHAARIPPQSAR